MMLEDRFDEPETKSMNEIATEAYEKYIEDFEEDGEPMNEEEFIDWYWRY